MIASTAQAETMDDLVGLLSKFQTYKAHFDQQSYDQSGEKLQTLQGTMILQKPDHFYWESEAPYEQKLVCNGKTIWHFDTDLDQVVIQDFAKQAEQAPILVVLRDPAKLAKSYTLLGAEKKKDSTLIFHLQAVDKKAALKTVDISFVKQTLSGLVFIDHLEQKTSIVFSSPELNAKFPASTFEFVLPEGVDVLYE